MVKLKKEIKHFIVLGDSLPDRGTLFERKLLGFIPMSLLSGLTAHSPNKRFTNGYVWLDYLAAMFAKVSAHDCCKQFNDWLEKEVSDLQAGYPHCKTDPYQPAKAKDNLDIEEVSLVNVFRKKYNQTFDKDRFALFWRTSNPPKFTDKDISLYDIFDHALNQGGKRTFKVLQKLQWLDNNGQLNLENIPVLREAYNQAVKKQPPVDVPKRVLSAS